MALGAGVFGAIGCLFVLGAAEAPPISGLQGVLIAAAAASFAGMFLLLTARSYRRRIRED